MRGIAGAVIGLSLAGLSATFACESCGKAGPGKLPGGAHVFNYFTAGGHLLDLSSLNAKLDAAGLDDFKAYGVSFGVGRYWSVRRLVMDHELQGLFWRDRTANNTRASLWAGYGLMNTGVNLLPPGKRLSVYPMAGIGFGVFGLDVLNDRRSFGDALTGAAPASSMMQGTFVVNLGVGVDLTKSLEGRWRAPGIGLRAGWTWDPTERTRWWSDGTAITGGPAPLLTGPYARLVVGLARPLRPKAQHQCDHPAT